MQDLIHNDVSVDTPQQMVDSDQSKSGDCMPKTNQTQDTLKKETDQETFDKADLSAQDQSVSEKTDQSSDSLQRCCPDIKNLDRLLADKSPCEIDGRIHQIMMKNAHITELAEYFKALENGSALSSPKAVSALKTFVKTGSNHALNQFKRCFPTDVRQGIIAKTIQHMQRDQRLAQQLKQRHRQIQTDQMQKQFESKYADWVKTPERRQAVETALKLGQVNTDLEALKTLVDQLEKTAVDNYLKKQAEEENRLRQEQIGSVSLSGQSAVTVHTPWLTREEFNRLTPREYEERYDRIVQQIELEKQGKLPRRLT